MEREATGAFNEAMLEYFGANTGAYTTFTQAELDKRTYNVKAVIRNLTEQQEIRFKICERAKIYNLDWINIPCKFSKKDKDEMTIYFSHELTNSFNAEANDIWYVYFIDEIIEPVIGVMSAEKWDNLFGEITENQLEPDETGSHELNYSGDISEIELKEVEAPERKLVQKAKKGLIAKSVSADEAARREKNRKNKGNRGEEIAIEIEKRRLTNLGRPDLISKITHVAKKKDGLGYDIISIDFDDSGKEQEIYIEVKTTAGDINMPFYVSARELDVSKRLKNLYYIYRIFNMTENATEVSYYRLRGAIDENYDLVAADYWAFRRLSKE